MKLADLQSSLEVNIVEVQAGNAPCVFLNVKVVAESGKFTGFDEGIQFLQEDWLKFLEGLDRMEKERKGFVELLSMTPDRFTLAFRFVDKTGKHLVAEGKLTTWRHHLWSPHTFVTSLSFEIEVDPADLKRIHDELQIKV